MQPLRPLAALGLVLLCGALVGDGLALLEARACYEARFKRLQEKVRAAHAEEEAEFEKVLTILAETSREAAAELPVGAPPGP